MAEDAGGAEVDNPRCAGFAGRAQNVPCAFRVDGEKFIFIDPGRPERGRQMKKDVGASKGVLEEGKVPNIAGDGFESLRLKDFLLMDEGPDLPSVADESHG